MAYSNKTVSYIKREWRKSDYSELSESDIDKLVSDLQKKGYSKISEINNYMSYSLGMIRIN